MTDPRAARLEFSVTLLAIGNTPPEFSTPPAIEAAADRPYRYAASASDPDGDTLTYQLTAAPDFLNIDSATGLVSGTPAADDVGTHQIELTANDGFGGTARQTFQLQVWTAIPNRPPIVQSLPQIQVVPGDAYAYQAQAEDLDGDVLRYTLDSAPPGMTINETTGLVAWPQAVSGTHPVSLCVDDNHGGQAQQIFVLTVGPGSPNAAPQFESAPPVRGRVGELYLYTAAASDPDGDSLRYSLTQAPPGMTVDAGTGLVQWQPIAAETGLQPVTLRVADQYGNAAVQRWLIDVASTGLNRPPTFVERAFSPFLTQDSPATLSLLAQDPEGAPLRYELVAAPAGMSLFPLPPGEGQGEGPAVISAQGVVLTWTPTAADLGWHRVVVRAYDPLDAYAQQVLYVEVRRPNTPPRFTSEPLTSGTAGAVHRDLLAAADDEDAFTYRLVAGPPGLTVDAASGLLFWRTTPADAGSHPITVRATDDRGLATDLSFTLALQADAQPPNVSVRLSDPLIDLTATSTVVAQVLAVDNVAVTNVTLSLNGTPLPPDAWHRYEFTPPAPGLYQFTATATDAAGNIGTATATLRVFDPADTTPPVVELTSPVGGDVLTYLTDVRGTVSDQNLEFYCLQSALAGTGQWTTFYDSAAERGPFAPGDGVIADVLGVFDPTLLQRDNYDLRVVAQDINGRTTIVQLGEPVSVEGRAVLGNFRLEFTDLTIPLAGIPIQIQRTYDTLNAQRSGDFGFGWQLSVAQANVRESVRTSDAERSGIAAMFAAHPFRDGTRVYLTNPAGRRVGFTFKPEPAGGVLGTLWHPRFVPDPGVYDQLTVEDTPLSQHDDGTYTHYLVNLPYNPSQYQLTTKDGLTYRYDQFDGLQDITDRNQNVLTYTADAITSSTGVTIRLERDAQGRITQITDPAGNAIRYTYDAAGDLASVANQTGDVTTYYYRADPAHYLDYHLCPSCVPMVRTEYDQAGRVAGTYDVLGNPVTQTYDVANNTETVADRLGHETTLTFDERGNIVSETNPLGHTVSYEYDAGDNLVAVTNARGYETQFRYDQRGNVVGSTDAQGQETSATYNQFDQIATATDPLGHTAVYNYDEQGNLIELVNAAGSRSFVGRDAQGRIASVTDNRGNGTTYEYAAGDQPVRVTNPDGSTQQFQYNTFGLVTSRMNENGETTTFQYDASGRVLAATDPAGAVTQFAYDASQLVSVTDALGRVQRFEQDAANRPIRTIDPAGNVTQFAYDANDRRTAVTDPLGRTTQVQYDAAGRIVSRTEGILPTVELSATSPALAPSMAPPVPGSSADDPILRTTSYEYDAAGNVIAVTDALGRVTRYEYDPLDRLIRVVDPAGGETRYTYDPLGNLLTDTDPLGRTTRYEYDALSRLVQVTDPTGGRWTYAYDADGNVVLLTDANDDTTSLAFDDRNRLAAWTDAAGGVTSYAYDDAGRVAAWTDPLGQTTAVTRDEAGRMLTRTAPLGGVASWTYDLAGNVLAATDELGRTTQYAYDDLNRLRSTTDPRGSETQFQYDAVGNLTAMIDPLANAWTYRYDAFDRLVAEIDPVGQARSYQYDAADNLVSQTDRNGRRTVFAYDDLDRLLTETWYVGDTPVNTLAFQYDAAGNLLTAGNTNSRYAYTYDDLDRVVTSDNAGTPGAPHVVLSYAYDAVDNVLSVADNLGVAQASTYDGRGLLTSRSWQGDTIDPVRVEFSYNALGQPTELRRVAGATASAPQIGRTTYAYDIQGRLTDLTHRNTADAVLVDYDYVRDLADQLIEETHHGQTSRYTYDQAGQLTAADHSRQPGEAYAYDANGNREQVNFGGTAAVYQSGPANRLLADGTYRYEYDAEGNLIRRIEAATGAATEYAYDHRNRLVQAREKSPGGIILRELTYTYDVFDRRIARTDDADGAGSIPPQTTRFIYDGAHVWADFDASGNITARYLFGQNIDQLLARYRPAEGVAWYLTDHLGTVRDLADAVGRIINHLDYDSFGQLLSQTNPAAGDRYTYTGREYDAALGQYDYRARHYDPHQGHFTTEDPFGFAPGDLNLYRYVGNSPLNWLDPRGHVAVAERGAVTEFGPVLALLRDPFTHCVLMSFANSTAISIGMDYILAPFLGPPSGPEIVAEVSLDFAFSAISCRLFPPAMYGNATFGAVAVSLTAILARAATVSAASKVVTLTTGHVFAYATSSGGGGGGGQGAAAPKGAELNRFPDWKPGDSITKATPDGNYPSWAAIRSRYWQNRAAGDATSFGPSNRAIMDKGFAPKARAIVRDRKTGEIREILVEKELHHARGNRGVRGFDEPMDIREVWPWEHERLVPSGRHLDYDFIRFK